jgi:DNA-directed RNA polymerase subunit RPC12/RpoP
MAFHCMNCNGSMVFDVSTQQMRCEHCGSTCDPQDFDTRDEAVVMASITCQNCGAELEGTEDSMVGFCPYCGGQSLVSRPGTSRPVEQIIPFKISREACVDAYTQYTRHVPYLNKEFKDAEHIKKFTGIYMPYYQFDATFGDAHIEGETVTHGPNYTEYRTYGIDVQMEGEYRHGTPFDASKYLDDEIAARCMPFDVQDELPYRPAYLAGFYADTSTVDPELYYPDAQAQAEQDLIGEVGNQVMEHHRIPLKSTSRVETNVIGHHSALFPLWFLTWRKDDRVAYAVINGQTGQVVSDLPLNLRSFALGSVAISALLFVVLELFAQPTPGLTAFASLVAAALMAWGIHASAKRVHQTQTHARDKGWTNKEGVNDKPVGEVKGIGSKLGAILGVIPMFVFAALVFMRGKRSSDFDINIDTLFDSHSSPLMKAAPVVVLLIVMFVLVKVLMWHKEMREWNAPVAIGALTLAVLVNAVIIFVAPANDGWYYLGDAVCIAGLVASSVAMLRVYNLATTRPLPKLFDREEV